MNMAPLRRASIFISALFLLAFFIETASCAAQDKADVNAPVVQKVEPPNWWVNLTPDVMLLVSGRNLRATRVDCNLPEVSVSRTQSSFNGDYLFVWLRLAPTLKRGTAVCRITTANGQTSFELPLAARKQI